MSTNLTNKLANVILERINQCRDNVSDLCDDELTEAEIEADVLRNCLNDIEWLCKGASSE